MREHREPVTSPLNKPWPVLPWLPGYGGKIFRLDLVAGLTAAAVVIPQAMAYATIAGLPVSNNNIDEKQHRKGAINDFA